MNISLTKEFEQYVNQKVESGLYQYRKRGHPRRASADEGTRRASSEQAC